VAIASLENTLRDLPRHGQRVEHSDDKQVWRFEHDTKAYLLHFYPRGDSLPARLRLGNRALRDFATFQAMQKAQVPSPRASSVLMGFRLEGQLGDALIVEAIEPSRKLDQLLFEHHLRGARVPCRYSLTRQVIEMIKQVARTGYRDTELGLGKFLVSADHRLHYADVSTLRRGGLRTADVMRLAHDARHLATRADLLRAWQILGNAPLPRRNRVTPRLWRRFARSATGENSYFGRIRDSSGPWSGHFTRRAQRPLRYASASRADVRRADWERAWPDLLARIESGTLERIKSDPSGDVLRGSVTLAGHSFDVIVKRPLRKRWYQPTVDLFRGSRALRTWKKTWQMLARDVPCEWPMLLMERRVLGYAVESVLVFERVPGVTLAAADLQAMEPSARSRFFRRAGHILRRIDDFGFFSHGDAKSTNWIVFDDPVDGATPVLIDLYGIRGYAWPMAGFNRLMRAMRQHPQFTPEDSLNFCRGYAPTAMVVTDHGEAVR
jgi:hypothetical protein